MRTLLKALSFYWLWKAVMRGDVRGLALRPVRRRGYRAVRRIR